MRPGPVLLTGAALLGALHVIGVLFDRPVWRPAELVATLCLLAYVLRAERSPAGGRRGSWWLSAAVAVLVAEAALTVPSGPGVGGGVQYLLRPQWVVLSPEEYSGLLWRTSVRNALPVVAVLVFVLILLVALHRRRPLTGRRRAAFIGGGGVGLLLTAAVVQTAVAQQRAVDEPTDAVVWAGVAVLLPALVIVAALALGLTSAVQRRWRATVAAVLLVGAGVLRLNVALGGLTTSYADRDSPLPFRLGVIPQTASLPEPNQALAAALILAAAILATSGLTRRDPEPARP